MRKFPLTPLLRGVFLIPFGAVMVACSQKNAGMQGGVPEYAVMTIEPSAVSLSNTYPATIRGRQDVEIRPNVSGFITRLNVDEGAVVKKGEVLFTIDQVQYAEAVKQAEAAVNVARSALATQQLTTDNKRDLAKRNIISQYDLQMAENSLASAQATLAQAEAQLSNARKNLSYTTVTSPADGVIGMIPYRVGSLVGPTSTTPLTTLSDNSEMYVYFSMNEKDLLDLMRRSENGHVNAVSELPRPQLRLADGTVYPEEGRIDALSGVIDLTTGAASVRAAFPNPERLLRSGGSGVVLLPYTDDDALLVPQKAVSEIQDKHFAYVVTDSMTVKATQIEVLSLNDGKNYVVTAGLKPGDKIVIEGVGTSVRDGMKITPITAEQSQAKLQGAMQQTAAMQQKK